MDGTPIFDLEGSGFSTDARVQFLDHNPELHILPPKEQPPPGIDPQADFFVKAFLIPRERGQAGARAGAWQLALHFCQSLEIPGIPTWEEHKHDSLSQDCTLDTMRHMVWH